MIIKLISAEARALARARVARTSTSSRSTSAKPSALSREQTMLRAIENIGRYIHDEPEIGAFQGDDDAFVEYYTSYLLSANPEQYDTVSGRVAFRMTRNFQSHTLRQQIDDMQILAHGHDHNIAEHFALSYGAEQVSHKQFAHDIDVLMRVLGAENCPALGAIHNDTAHNHGHALILRIDAQTGRSVSLGRGFSYEAAQVAVAICERDEGRKREPNGLFVATDRGVYTTIGCHKVADAEGNIDATAMKKARHARDQFRLDNQLPNRDLALAGDEVWDAERTAQLLAGPWIKASRSWTELHENLGAIGMRYRQTASGGQLVMGDDTIKASAAGYHAKHSELIKSERLGAYQPPEFNLAVRPFSAPRFETKDPAFDRDTREMRKTLRSQDRERDAEAADVVATRIAADAAQNREYLECFAMGRDAKNAKRAEIAARRKAEAELLKEARASVKAQARMPDMNARYRPKKARRPNPRLAQDVPHLGLLCAAQDDVPKPNRAPVLEAAYLRVSDGHTIKYLKDFQVSLIETENLLLIANAKDEAARRDALRLAAARWGKVHIYGDPKFVAEMSDLARAMKIEITNERTGADLVRSALQSAKSAHNSLKLHKPSPIDQVRNRPRTVPDWFMAKPPVGVKLDLAKKHASFLAELARHPYYLTDDAKPTDVAPPDFAQHIKQQAAIRPMRDLMTEVKRGVTVGAHNLHHDIAQVIEAQIAKDAASKAKAAIVDPQLSFADLHQIQLCLMANPLVFLSYHEKHQVPPHAPPFVRNCITDPTLDNDVEHVFSDVKDLHRVDRKQRYGTETYHVDQAFHPDAWSCFVPLKTHPHWLVETKNLGRGISENAPDDFRATFAELIADPLTAGQLVAGHAAVVDVVPSLDLAAESSDRSVAPEHDIATTDHSSEERAPVYAPAASVDLASLIDDPPLIADMPVGDDTEPEPSSAASYFPPGFDPFGGFGM